MRAPVPRAAILAQPAIAPTHPLPAPTHHVHRRLARRVRLAPRAVIALLALAAAPSARAQRVLGAGESADAFLVPGGAARFTIGQSFSGYTERFGIGGVRESLSAQYNATDFGATNFPALRALDADVRTLAGEGVSLGRLETRVNQLVRQTRLDLDVGVARWLNVGFTFPFVFTRTDVSATLNANGSGGNLGRNPVHFGSTTARDEAAFTNAALASQLQSAASRLDEKRQNECGSSTTGGNCQVLQQLVNDANAYRAAVVRSYGTSVGSGSTIVPRRGSAAQTALEARLTALSAAIGAQLGETNPVSVRPVGAADVPLVTPDLDTIAATGFLGVSGGDGAFGVIEHGHVGDMEVRVRSLIFDTFGGRAERRLSPTGFNARAVATGTFRFGTGSPDLPYELFDVGSGDGQHDVEAGVTLDALFGSRAWASVTARYTVQLSDELPRRITESPTDILPEAFRERVVGRDLGDVLHLELAPRYSLTDHLGVAAFYAFRRKGEDAYTGTFQVAADETFAGTALTLDAATLGLESAQQEHRIGWSVTYSTLRSVNMRRARLPLEVSFSHVQVLRGSGFVPKVSTDRAQLRFYTGLLGGPPPI